jgi:hypothetical protein
VLPKGGQGCFEQPFMTCPCSLSNKSKAPRPMKCCVRHGTSRIKNAVVLGLLIIVNTKASESTVMKRVFEKVMILTPSFQSSRGTAEKKLMSLYQLVAPRPS